MNFLFLAGGAFLGVVATQPEPDLINHTLRGEKVPAKEIVCRNRWGTLMLPDGKGGYSLISPINQDFIDFSLVQPPKSRMEAFRPTGTVVTP
jgi:hypothetical protein